MVIVPRVIVATTMRRRPICLRRARHTDRRKALVRAIPDTDVPQANATVRGSSGNSPETASHAAGMSGVYMRSAYF